MAEKNARSTKLVIRINPLMVFGLGYYFFLRPQMLKAGTLLGESQRRLHGDDIIVSPNLQSTRAIDIDAPPEAVWPWIAQMGRDRSGYYGLDNFTNNGIPSVAYLRQDMPTPSVGMALDGGYRILDVEANRMLLYGAFDNPTIFGEPMELTTLLLLERKRDGGTRLLIRTRGYMYGLLGKLYNLAYEIVDYFHATAQLKSIKQRAETMQHLRAPARAPEVPEKHASAN